MDKVVNDQQLCQFLAPEDCRQQQVPCLVLHNLPLSLLFLPTCRLDVGRSVVFSKHAQS
jgi:hypothetical protein